MRYKLLMFIPLFLLVACEQQPESGRETRDEVVLVKVDGEPVTLPMLERVMEARGVSEDEHERMRALLDELVRMQAVANAAEAEGLETDPEVRADLRLARLQTFYRHYINRAQQAEPVTEEDIEAVYEAQLERSGDTQYRIAAIRYADPARGRAALSQLAAGETDFARLQRQAEQRGLAVDEPGWIDRSQVPGEFAHAMADTDVDGVVPMLLESGQGWHLVRVLETRPLEAPGLDEVREGIARSLLQDQRQRLIESLYDQAEITPMLPLEEADPEPEE
ncbi:hypothetical protein G4Y73_06755 [Wenzhouxiangella sp. XN201]|uniref:peptidylprolyl isomerase n=1 Tax=Wenzhouxiangella sp. XN201 TaxID=2710755 RepID=UPI0013C778D0|nr:peptidylprolyl isomerase [Wenzhouxiangella sp. XN201]NEZ03847.1 hypothetical protein [Wenzhouxiangella sp. XN201]